ncbi:carboxypeptidase B-like [Anabrus simplex]|uniref:carboxypeptidase B-like n=1 Tax=Anabrus simplex TaxID=316456 RepID=UPI0035A2CC11
MAVTILVRSRKTYEGYKVFHITPSRDQINLLEQFYGNPAYDFWTGSRKAGSSWKIMVSPNEIHSFSRFLHRNNLSYAMNDVQMASQPENIRDVSEFERTSSKPISFNKYLRYNKMIIYLAWLASNYPDIVSTKCIGSTFYGRPINMITISSGGNNTKPSILINAGIHAREWITPAMALYTINQLVENRTNHNLFSAVDWHIIPVLNVDGYEYSHTTDRLWRKTRSTTSNKLCRGVDGNRNFDFHWMENGASANPCSSNYAGVKPFSESEIAAFRNFVLANADRLKLFLDLHSTGREILYPWGYCKELPKDWKKLHSLAHKANRAQMSVGGARYDVGSSTHLLYPAAGASDDWIKGVANISLSYTVELPEAGVSGWDMPASKIEITVSQFFEAVRVFGEYVTENYGWTKEMFGQAIL